jgi:hypothetical protein
MIGKNLLWVAEQHGHSAAVMLKVYAKWMKGATEKDVEAIRVAMGFVTNLALAQRAKESISLNPFGNVLAVGAVTREPCSAANSLLTGKNTGNFARSAGSNQLLFLVNPRPEPISSHCTCFRRKSEQGINRERIRELAGA